jgi:REP element-mobilizing transposase RayT
MSCSPWKAAKASFHRSTTTNCRIITGLVSRQKPKLIAINNMPDHLHILVGLTPDMALSDLLRDVKAGSSKFINEKHASLLVVMIGGQRVADSVLLHH